MGYVVAVAFLVFIRGLYVTAGAFLLSELPGIGVVGVIGTVIIEAMAVKAMGD
jgi:hypothetical protein